MTVDSPLDIARGSEYVSRSRGNALMLLCSVCGSDAGEPIGVVGTFAEKSDDTIAIRCGRCSTIYLTPELSTRTASRRAVVLMPRRVREWSRRLGPDARVLCMDDVAGGHASDVPRQQVDDRYDLILLPLTLETAKNPIDVMRHVRSRLRSGGCAAIIVHNTDSSCFRVFGGRHWSGYRSVPAGQHFNSAALEHLSRSAGLRIMTSATSFCSAGWLASAAHWLRDWGARESVVKIFTAQWYLPQALAMVLEAFSVLRGRGSLLVAFAKGSDDAD